MAAHRVLCVVGTRPEAIKMAPVIGALKSGPAFRCTVLATAQHRQLLDQVLSVFNIEPDIDLNIMRPNQGLNVLTARLLLDVDAVLDSERPEAVLVQGDTTTVMATALASFHRRIPFGHVEAGLRTGDLSRPFPEEMNRVVAGRLATWHFAPTKRASQNLLAEGVPESSVTVTGNTVIDALLSVAQRSPSLDIPLDPDRRLLLVTAHRRENFGSPMLDICRALVAIVEEHPDVEVLFPVHPNPNVTSVVQREIAGHPRIKLSQPLQYVQFIAAMQRAHLILTDSGGVQEEAPALAKPVLVLREETERPEAVEAGVAKLVGARRDDIVSAVRLLLTDEAEYTRMSRGASPYGDGHAAERIVRVLRSHFGLGVGA